MSRIHIVAGLRTCISNILHDFVFTFAWGLNEVDGRYRRQQSIETTYQMPREMNIDTCPQWVGGQFDVDEVFQLFIQIGHELGP